MCNGGDEDRRRRAAVCVQPCGSAGPPLLQRELSSWPEAQLAIALALLPSLRGYLPFMRRGPCHPRMLANLSDERAKVCFFSVVPREQQVCCCEMCYLYPGDEVFETRPGLFGRQDAVLKPGDTLIVPPTKVLFVSAGTKLEGIMMKMLPADLGPQNILEPVGFFPIQCVLEQLPEEGLKLAAEVKEALPSLQGEAAQPARPRPPSRRAEASGGRLPEAPQPKAEERREAKAVQPKAEERREAKAKPLEARRQERTQGKAAEARQERRAPPVQDEQDAAAAERAAARAEAELLLELDKEEAGARRKLALKLRRKERKRNRAGSGEALGSAAGETPPAPTCNPQGSPDGEPPQADHAPEEPATPPRSAAVAWGNPQGGSPGSPREDLPPCSLGCQEEEDWSPSAEQAQEKREERGRAVSETEAAAREAAWRTRKQSSWTPDATCAPVARTFIHFEEAQGRPRRSRSA